MPVETRAQSLRHATGRRDQQEPSIFSAATPTVPLTAHYFLLNPQLDTPRRPQTTPFQLGQIGRANNGHAFSTNMRRTSPMVPIPARRLLTRIPRRPSDEEPLRGYVRGATEIAQFRNAESSTTAAIAHQQQENLIESDGESSRPTTPLRRPIILPDDGWTPTLAVGASLGNNLSRRQVAERKVQQWKYIYEWHRRNIPDALSVVQESVDRARRERDELEDNVENNTPIAELASLRTARIQQRIQTLRAVLAVSAFGPEQENIRTAVTGYERGAIAYGEHYTLIYAGRVVDTCSSYGEFMADRQQRLARYGAVHGPGWLWWEPPLAGERGGGGVSRAYRGVALENHPDSRSRSADMGHYDIRMGFRRRKDLVANGTNSGGNAGQTAGKMTKKRSGPRHLDFPPTEADTSAPRIVHEVLLDSGATYPTLYRDDLRALGIDPSLYSAQSATRISVVGGIIDTPLYEMDVEVVAGDEVSLVEPFRFEFLSPASAATSTTVLSFPSPIKPAAKPTTPEPEPELLSGPVWPAEPHFLGASTPVVILPDPPRLKSKTRTDNNGASVSTAASQVGGGSSNLERLSGFLPFNACYLSSAPGLFRLWLGEDRADVLGAHRMPGQLWFAARRLRAGEECGGDAAKQTQHPTWLWRGLGNPSRIVFEHTDEDRGTVVLDVDEGGRGKSVVSEAVRLRRGRSGSGGAGSSAKRTKTRTWVVEPRVSCSQRQAVEKAVGVAKGELQEKREEMERKWSEGGRGRKRKRDGSGDNVKGDCAVVHAKALKVGRRDRLGTVKE